MPDLDNGAVSMVTSLPKCEQYVVSAMDKSSSRR